MEFSLLRELSAAPGVSGAEDAVRALVRRELAALGAEVEADGMGNLVARVPGPGPRLLVAAHMDEVGLLVRHVDEGGFCRVVTVGGIDPRVLYGQAVVVRGERDLAGVIGAAPPHLAGGGDRERVVPVDELFVDLGLPPGEAAALVRPGDPVTFPAFWAENDWGVQARALDDRAGLFVMLEALRRAGRPACDLYLAATVQEEVGLRGAVPVADRVRPDLVLVLEGTVANDLPGVPPHQVLAALGRGPELRLSDGRFLADREWTGFAAEVAAAAGLPRQVVVKKVGGTDAAVFQNAGGAARAAVLSLPVRYLHAPVGVACKADIEAAVALTAALMEQAPAFRPGRGRGE
ncbi:M42 family metallopeptidase [Dissulfurirhabdus thermomarina]|uniref:M42 family metallopeptidase n=1 Tax=Dissulfurirhabdus thermomarina TaxID=1765737 RepID=A0A6N9TU70_DISTH|nr:M20/M25/M40 family metallo-hydrolase [Dissulfurirhabdus thermomarina]NDY43284.1 M42 family metallopeptidase [Dissulfurirhabdus thermomarina]NMX24492.1 M42 family metallopeptidase [Dissulfurirhabdus thermomarina]